MNEDNNELFDFLNAVQEHSKANNESGRIVGLQQDEPEMAMTPPEEANDGGAKLIEFMKATMAKRLTDIEQAHKDAEKSEMNFDSNVNGDASDFSSVMLEEEPSALANSGPTSTTKERVFVRGVFQIEIATDSEDGAFIQLDELFDQLTPTGDVMGIEFNMTETEVSKTKVKSYK